MITPAWRAALRRAAIPLVLGVVCLLVAWPAIEDLDWLLKAVGTILLILGGIIAVATARALTAEEKRLASR